MKKENIKAKSYTISSLYQNEKSVPFIKITGKWLEEHNFKIGDKIKVSIGKDILLLVKEK